MKDSLEIIKENEQKDEKTKIISEFDRISDYIMMTKDHFKVHIEFLYLFFMKR